MPKSPKKSHHKTTSKKADEQPLLLPAQAASLLDETSSRATAKHRALMWIRGYGAAFSAIVLTLAAGLLINAHALQTRPVPLSVADKHDPVATAQLRDLSNKVQTLAAAQKTAEIRVADDSDLQQQLSQIDIDIASDNHTATTKDLSGLASTVASAQTKLTQLSLAADASSEAAGGLTIPILLYHQYPDDFPSQLDILQQKNYHTVTMAQVAAALHGQGVLPPKPVVIGFDDGYANQLKAVQPLQDHHMTGIFYIIDGGSRSRWCLGASRRYNDPLQPPTGCGDAYMSWDQIRQLDKGGVITIGSHTVDHEDLALQPLDEQQYQISEGKKELEQQLGHKVYDFAYPYGDFTATTISLVQAAGFRTAVITKPGITQTLGGIYTMPRMRDATQLP